MNAEAKPANRRYRAWRDSVEEQDLDFAKLMDGIWSLLHQEASETEEGLWYLICFIQRVKQAQNNLILDLCHRFSADYWDTLTDRATCLYARLKPQLDILENRIQQGSQVFYPYFYRVLEYNLILCNKEVIDSLMQARKDAPRTDWLGGYDDLGDAVSYGKWGKSVPAPKTLKEIQDDIQTQERAQELYKRLREDWHLKHLNALCHYYEVLCGHCTRRLAREGNPNIDKIHSRLREKLCDYIEEKGFQTEEVRLFCVLWLPDLCQVTPVLETYRDVREEQNA